MVVDRHLDPLVTEFVPLAGDAASRRTLYLQTSPEFAMKRLLAAGGEAIYQIAHAFRQGEVGRLHNPEFTMVEWYRTGDDLASGIQLLSDLAEALLERGPAERVSYAEVFQRAAGIDPHRGSIESLRVALQKRGVVPPESLGEGDRDGWLDLLLVELVEPTLGHERPAIVYDYPPSQCALAKLRKVEDEPFMARNSVAERFELYLGACELANGYHELNDAAEQRARFERDNARRRERGLRELPIDENLLRVLDDLPGCSGVALGVDRLLMCLLQTSDIRDVLAFPFSAA